MKDTSFAIHPEKKATIQNQRFYDIGKMIYYQKKDSYVYLICEQGHVFITFYRDDIVRVIMNPSEKPKLQNTPAVIMHPEEVMFHLEESQHYLSINSSKITIHIEKDPCRIRFYDQDGRLIVSENEKGMGHNHKQEVICFKEMDHDEHFYGLGEKTGFLDKRGEKWIMWNTDVYAPHNPETNELYQSIPFFISLRNGKSYGIFFNNTYKTIFNFKTDPDTYSFYAEGGQLDYYLFVGPHPKQVIEQYTQLTGRMPLPPKWALGYHQSRYSYESEQEVRQVAKTFLEKNIPIDALYLDIHYMDEYRVFTFNNNRFSSPLNMVKDLKQLGIHVVPIVDPGVKEDPEYSIYQEGIGNDYFCKYIEGKLFYGDVWPGNSAFPDFTNSKVRQWWGEKHQFYTDMGIEGIWNDMNEPAVFNESKTMDLKVMHDNDGDPATHRALHNVYGMRMGEATYHGLKKLLKGKRPFLLTRAGFAGIQRYAAVWTGDNRSFWEHLSLAVPMLMNLGLSGVAFSGTDVGGFAHDATGELLTRWTQLGAFSPFFRNHSAIDTVRQEPWSFGEKYELIIKKYIQLRYQWLPHFYTLFAEASKTGIPVMRPLFLEYPEDQHTFNLFDQFMIGDQVIVAPVLQPDTVHRIVYLPEGIWYHYWTGKKYDGRKHHLIEADLDILPIFIKAGAIIAHGSIKTSTAQADTELIFHLYPPAEGEASYLLYDDDGKSFAYQDGVYLEKKITYRLQENAGHITCTDLANQYKPTWKQMTFHLHDVNKDISIFINGEKVEPDKISYQDEKKISSITITV